MSNCTCPACEGVPPSPVLAFINAGEDFTKHRQEVVTTQCKVCNGAGVVGESILHRFKAGKEFREVRVNLGVSLFESAKALGVTPAQLSAYEHGYADLPTGQTAG